MIDEIKRLSTNRRLREFSSFILSQTTEGVFPCYSKVDLMTVPHLVPNVYVFDVLNSSGNLIFKYCGTKVDEFYGTNMSGRSPAQRGRGDGSFGEIENVFWQGIRQKKPVYSIRPFRFLDGENEKFKVVECIQFPCSSDGSAIDYAIGFADYYNVPSEMKTIATLIE